MKTGKLWQLSTIAVRLGIEGGFLLVGGHWRVFGLQKQLKTINW